MSILKKYLAEAATIMLENIMSLEISFPLSMQMEMAQRLSDEFFIVDDIKTKGHLTVVHKAFVIGHIEFNVDDVYKIEIKFVPSEDFKKPF